jgi:hypothetical protein
MLDARELYTAECLVVIFDLRDPDAVARLRRERAAWQERSDIEALDEDHFALVIKPGGAWRLAG